MFKSHILDSGIAGRGHIAKNSKTLVLSHQVVSSRSLIRVCLTSSTSTFLQWSARPLLLLLVRCLRSRFIATARCSAGIVWKNKQLNDEKNIGDDASDDHGVTELIEDRLHSQIRDVCDGESYHANVYPQQSGCHEQLGPSVIFNAAHMLKGLFNGQCPSILQFNSTNKPLKY